MSEADAARRVTEWARASRESTFDVVYKKTDSVLRGPVAAEVTALLRALGKRSALLVPQNPSRGRVIRDGKYFIGDVPLDQTEFARDPDHPARTSDVRQMVSGEGLSVGEGGSTEDLCRWAAQVDADILPAGGADFFRSVLEAHGLHERKAAPSQAHQGSALIVCGSASSLSARMVEQARMASVPICAMSLTAQWADAVVAALTDRGRAVMWIGQAIDSGPGVTLRFRTEMAEAVAAVLSSGAVDTLYIAGGATASAICERMGWREFDVKVQREMVQLQAHGSPRLIIQPGSYEWPQWVFSEG